MKDAVKRNGNAVTIATGQTTRSSYCRRFGKSVISIAE